MANSTFLQNCRAKGAVTREILNCLGMGLWQWLGLSAFAAGSLGSVPGLGTVTLQTQHSRAQRTRHRSTEGQSTATGADSKKISDQQPSFTS